MLSASFYATVTFHFNGYESLVGIVKLLFIPHACVYWILRSRYIYSSRDMLFTCQFGGNRKAIC